MNQELLELYKKTLRIRLIEEAIAEKYQEQKMRCPTHLSIGQELTPVVVSSYLSKNDKVYSSHRAHAHYLAKGGCLVKLIAELLGKKTGCTGGIGGSMHLSDLDCGFVASTAIVANSIPVAVGNALSQQLDGSKDLTVSYFGEGATEEGAFYESINFAAVKKLPILFICENNRYSVYSSLAPRQPSNRNIVSLVNSMGVNAYSMEGNCLQPLMDNVKIIIDKIRSGCGPFFLETFTYRHREHCGPNFDDDLGYRNADEVARWMKMDPIKLLENQLNIPTTIRDELEAAIFAELNSAFNAADVASSMSVTKMQDLVYAK